MTTDQIIQISISVLSGGACGAIITNIISARNNRISTIGIEENTSKVFSNKIQSSMLDSKISISDGTGKFEYENLFLYELRIVNTSKKDFDKFNFGLTLDKNAKFIFIESESEDRHHNISASKIAPSLPSEIVDITLEPFNRKNEYKIRGYYINEKEHGGICKISSSHSVRFTGYQVIQKTALEIAFEIIKSSMLISIPSKKT